MKATTKNKPQARLKVRNLPPAPYPRTPSTKRPYFPTEADGIKIVKLEPGVSISMPDKYKTTFTPEEEEEMIRLMNQGVDNFELGEIMGRNYRVIASKRKSYKNRGLITETRRAKTKAES